MSGNSVGVIFSAIKKAAIGRDDLSHWSVTDSVALQAFMKGLRKKGGAVTLSRTYYPMQRWMLDLLVKTAREEQRQDMAVCLSCMWAGALRGASLVALEWENVMRFGKSPHAQIYHEGTKFEAAPGFILLEDMFLPLESFRQMERERTLAPPSGRLFPFISEATINAMIARVARAQGWASKWAWSEHCLRVGRAVELYEQGDGLEAVRRLLRHAPDSKVTRWYAAGLRSEDVILPTPAPALAARSVPLASNLRNRPWASRGRGRGR